MGIACIKTLARTLTSITALFSEAPMLPHAPPSPCSSTPSQTTAEALTWRTVPAPRSRTSLAVFARSGQQAAVVLKDMERDHVLVTVNCLHGAHDYRLFDQVPDHHLHSRREPALNPAPPQPHQSPRSHTPARLQGNMVTPEEKPQMAVWPKAAG